MAEQDLGRVDEYMVVEGKEIVDFLLNIVGKCLRDFQDGQHRSRVAPGCLYMVDVEAYDENWERKQQFDDLFLLAHHVNMLICNIPLRERLVYIV